ncbi:type IV pilus biogenesis/stability protein PilW [Sorangium sp. So ce1667]
MNNARFALSAACLSSALAAASAASAADPDPAQAAFDRGVAHMEAGRFDEGCPAIEASQKLDPRPGTLFTLAECEALRGRLATALARFDEYLALYPTLTPKQQQNQGDREKVAREQRATLARDAPAISLSLPPDAPPAAVVKLDGQVVAPTAIGSLIQVDPGTHSIALQVPGGPVSERIERLGKGEKKHVALTLAVPRPPPPPAHTRRAPAPDTGAGGRRVAVYLAGGLGLVGLAVGGVTGALAMERKAVVDKSCAGTACNHEGKTAADAMKALGLASTIAFGVGIAGVGGAAVLLLTEPKATSAGASSGAWLAAGVAPVGSGGAALDVRGAW